MERARWAEAPYDCSNVDVARGSRQATVHGGSETLVEALRERSEFYATAELEDGESHLHVSAVTNRQEQFERGK